MTSEPPPLTSTHAPGLTPLEIKRTERNEKARLRMARKRAELVFRPLEEQKLVAERAKIHQAKYRAKHREELRRGEAERRAALYKARYGPEACLLYQARGKRKRSPSSSTEPSEKLDDRECP
ncbi:hypothetical protein DFH08DRAFT_1087906 [Mycena albidolilacea]|uniref:Uncharacterized protein n=1 Tax=Mycena albidolilacea TaxID=1033008 RepID=A0AAD7ECG2_9AGAR|nr:hypothetical protein DFH08DRAFT_1087906 [Mycena albidolilacea]